MNSFEQTRTVEAEALQRLRPFITERSGGQFVLCEKGALAQYLQETIGDLLMHHQARGQLLSVEVKAERDASKNLYLETWSNRNLDDREKHARFGSNPGWLLKLRADLLFYYFLAVDYLYILDLFKLQRWAFNVPQGQTNPRIYDFTEKRQGKYVQQNDTWGCCVPISVLFHEVGYQLVHPQQFTLPFVEEGAA